MKSRKILLFYSIIGGLMVALINKFWISELDPYDFFAPENDPKKSKNVPRRPKIEFFSTFFPDVRDTPGGHNFDTKNFWPRLHMPPVGHFQVLLL